jgi:signal transduction histidine kinase
LLVEGEELCPATVAEALYRIVLEALNNTLKHSLATTVTVDIRINDEQAELEVTDNGQGFDPQVGQNKGGMGLNSMRERAERLGGRLELISTPGQGTKVKVTIGTHLSSPRQRGFL